MMKEEMIKDYKEFNFNELNRATSMQTGNSTNKKFINEFLFGGSTGNKDKQSTRNTKQDYLSKSRKLISQRKHK